MGQRKGGVYFAATSSAVALLALLGAAGCATQQRSGGRWEQEIAELSARIKALEEQRSPIDRANAPGQRVVVRRATEVPIAEESAKQIQRALELAGFYQGSIDGKIGAKTRQAIKEFQRSHRLAVDGQVGPKTWAQLKQYIP